MNVTGDKLFNKNCGEKLEDQEYNDDLGSVDLMQTNPSSPEPGSVPKAVDNNQTIIMDGDGNYYYQSSGKMIKIEPFVTKGSRHNSETDNREKVYEFDENELDPDDPRDIPNSDYEVIMKDVRSSKPNEPVSFACMICSYRTNKKFALSRHLKSHCGERPYKCEVCERGFKTKSAVLNHRNIHSGKKPYACKSCDMAFNSSGELTRHERYRHTHIKPHKCTECDYSSVEVSKLRRHMRCHTGERPYQCPDCTYASPDSFKLKRHMRTHTGEKPYECEICHARFTQSNSLKQHRLVHSVNEKPIFQCHLCPTTCGRKTDLRLHIKNLHTSDKPIPCKRCGKELPDRYSYKMHIKTHEGEKCYRCEHCPYAAISQRHLESHVLIHLDAKPFVCEKCQTSFRQKQLLARHEKMYHSKNYEPPQPRKKDHKCPHCNKMFAFNGNLIRHMEIHDPTSQLFDEKEKLKFGRMKRVNPDGTVTVVMPSSKLSKLIFDGIDEIYEEAEEEKVAVEESQEEIKKSEEESICNVEKAQYVYDKYEADEYVFKQNEEQQYERIAPEEDALKNAYNQSIILKSEHRNDSEILVLEEHDDQSFVVIEVLPDDADDDEQLQEQEKVHPAQQQQFTPNTIINNEDTKPSTRKLHKGTQSLLQDYFGFEVNMEDDETIGAVKILEMIEQE